MNINEIYRKFTIHPVNWIIQVSPCWFIYFGLPRGETEQIEQMVAMRQKEGDRIV